MSALPWREELRAGGIAGPWDGEPDRLEFRAAGLPCLLVRNGSGAWCGYAAVPPGHPLHGKGYSDPELEEVSAHGGLTYAAGCQGKICHVPAPGEPDDVWWFGFDCSHAWDISPSDYWLGLRHPGLFERPLPVPTDIRIPASLSFGSYKTMAYARAEAERLARQLAEVRQ